MKKVLRSFVWVSNRIADVSGFVVAVCVVLQVLAIVTGVAVRNVFGMGFPWLEDIARWMLAWLVFVGGARLSRINDHIAMEALYDKASSQVQHGLRYLHGLTGAGTAAILTWYGYQNLERVIDLGQRSRSSVFPGWLGYAALPVGMALTVVAYLGFLLWLDVSERIEAQPIEYGAVKNP